MTKRLTAKQKVLKAAMRWKKFHCDQLTDGTCAECTRLWKVIASAARRLR